MSNRVSGPSLIAGIIFTLFSYLVFSFLFLTFNYNEWNWSDKILFIILEVVIVVQMFDGTDIDNSENG